MICPVVVTFYEVKNWTLDLRTTKCSHCSRYHEWWELFPPFLSLHNRQHLVQLKSSLLDHLTLWPVCSKLKQMAPPEHCQKILFGSNAHLRNNIKIYLRLNSTVYEWWERSPPLFVTQQQTTSGST